VILAVAAAIAGFVWWRWRQQAHSSRSRSSFKFPAAGASKVDTSTSSLPRGKASNNKKNKARKKQEKDRRADKREQYVLETSERAHVGAVAHCPLHCQHIKRLPWIALDIIHIYINESSFPFWLTGPKRAPPSRLQTRALPLLPSSITATLILPAKTPFYPFTKRRS
jgi:hypothetical protein